MTELFWVFVGLFLTIVYDVAFKKRLDKFLEKRSDIRRIKSEKERQEIEENVNAMLNDYGMVYLHLSEQLRSSTTTVIGFVMMFISMLGIFLFEDLTWQFFLLAAIALFAFTQTRQSVNALSENRKITRRYKERKKELKANPNEPMELTR